MAVGSLRSFSQSSSCVSWGVTCAGCGVAGTFQRVPEGSELAGFEDEGIGLIGLIGLMGRSEDGADFTRAGFRESQ